MKMKYKCEICNGKSKDKIITEGSLSQYVSGFMMAAHRLRNGLKIHLTNPKETPYLDMTKKWLRYQNIKCKITPDYSYIRVMHAEEKSMINVTIPADWESVAFPLIASLITKSDVTINGVSYSSGLFAQGDSEIVGILWSVGANLQLNYDEQTLHIRGGERLSTDNLPDKILHINISSMPDEICALSVIACFIDGTTIFHDVEICRKKETDRVYAMCTELSKLGFDIKESDDKKDLIVHGKFPEDLVDKSRSEIVRKIKEDLEKKMVDTNLFFTTGTDLVEKNNQKFTTGTDLVDFDEKIPEKYSNVSSVKTSYPIVLESYKDHRVAMALACAGLGLKEGESVIINDAECCSISFPGFYELMNKLGAGFEEV